MPKPAYVFDGRKILDHERLTKIGERVGGTVWSGLPGQCGRLPFDGLGERRFWFSFTPLAEAAQLTRNIVGASLQSSTGRRYIMSLSTKET